MKLHWEAFLDEIANELPYLTLAEILHRYVNLLKEEGKLDWNGEKERKA